uniref:Neur_chan_LBD domain-containing protein n=1 Tax=Bursaphelenchus xylophilus TaxID=6326 RepID=A0A1I7SU57_BURXY
MIWVRLFVVGFLWTRAQAQLSAVDVEATDPKEDEAGAIANKTYAEEHTSLQRDIFMNYNRNLRPIKNQSMPLKAQAHVYIMHFSVQEQQQSMKLYGHIYMTWFDEMAVWEPSNYTNVRSTMVSQWQLWQPEIKVANSIAGSGQYFEISKRSHAALTSITSTMTKVEIYPTFSISIGCNFDFSDYPFDEQECALRFYNSNPMSEVELLVYYELKPSVMLAWNDTNKKFISNWMLENATANISYYYNREYNDTRPETAAEKELTWSILVTKIKLIRNCQHYWVTLAIPAFCSMMVNAFSFLFYKSELSILTVIANFFIQLIFMFNELVELPPSAGEPPRIEENEPSEVLEGSSESLDSDSFLYADLTRNLCIILYFVIGIFLSFFLLVL